MAPSSAKDAANAFFDYAGWLPFRSQLLDEPMDIACIRSDDLGRELGLDERFREWGEFGRIAVNVETVYRTLDEFARIGLVHHVHHGNQPGQWHLTMNHDHLHLVCERCGDTRLVPTEEVVELVKGKRRTSSRKFYPGYILVRMELTDGLDESELMSPDAYQKLLDELDD